MAASFILFVPWDSPHPPELFWEVSPPQTVLAPVFGHPHPSRKGWEQGELWLGCWGEEAPKRGLDVAPLLLCTCVEEKWLPQLCHQWDKLVNELINGVLGREVGRTRLHLPSLVCPKCPQAGVLWQVPSKARRCQKWLISP